ncbi:hypothetical protein DR64_2390 [Paraburkholderia xenovorans LB400]|uniref:Transmembrane protein n=1 Tax=Paraburkholderia xenovorans (strain LB400) TaxID=266265 RepID=Q13T76_PARXL|nr:hypothetical protein [Paraburkholderia xenovorans]ABE32713.1 hypothetical protein Bxe_A0218 [Paraburkholderia xenovorans LB400]AIP31725.1 hypothetical protein DR64_2390 [Paraburkholderia xenovorans LB400]
MTESTSLVGALTSMVSAFGDRYDRNARLKPALLMLLPALVAIVALYHDALGTLGTIVTLASGCGLPFLLADFARSLGVAREPELWKSWGGAPSTQLLRHADSTVDAVSKARYHSFLAEKISTKFPTPAAEKQNSEKADAVYASATKWLRGATRDEKKFRLLLNDNITYGFRRNAYGLRGFGIAVSALTFLWVCLRHGFAPFVARVREAKEIETLFSAGEWMSLLFALIMLVTWIAFFSKASVRAAAFSYADKLILACETLMKPDKKSTSREGKKTPSPRTGREKPIQ